MADVACRTTRRSNVVGQVDHAVYLYFPQLSYRKLLAIVYTIPAKYNPIPKDDHRSLAPCPTGHILSAQGVAITTLLIYPSSLISHSDQLQLSTKVFLLDTRHDPHSLFRYLILPQASDQKIPRPHCAEHRNRLDPTSPRAKAVPQPRHPAPTAATLRPHPRSELRCTFCAPSSLSLPRSSSSHPILPPHTHTTMAPPSPHPHSSPSHGSYKNEKR